MQNMLLTKVKDWTFMCLLSGLLFGPDGYYAVENASHLNPSVITQLFLFEIHSHGSTVFLFGGF